MMVFGSSSLGSAIQKLGEEFGVDFDTSGASVEDAFLYNLAESTRGSVALVDSTSVPAIVGDAKAYGASSPVLYNGIGHHIREFNPLLTTVLHGNPTTVVTKKNKPVKAMGQGVELSLVSVLQARNNARMAWIGSSLMFTDDYFSAAVELPNGKAK